MDMMCDLPISQTQLGIQLAKERDMNVCSWPTTEKKSTKTTLDSVPLTGEK